MLKAKFMMDVCMGLSPEIKVVGPYNLPTVLVNLNYKRELLQILA